MAFTIKRIYDAPSPSDGKRVLVDRIWPRGVSKARAALDDWMKDIAPSPELRTWFNHLPERMDEFARRYVHELETDPAKQRAAAALGEMAKEGDVTLLYAAHDRTINQANVLCAWLNATQNR